MPSRSCPGRLLQVVDVGRHVSRALDAAAAVEAAAAAAAAAGPKVISSRPNWKAQMGLQRQVGGMRGCVREPCMEPVHGTVMGLGLGVCCRSWRLSNVCVTCHKSAQVSCCM